MQDKKILYDYLIVGAGLFGSVFAHEAKKAGKRVLVIDKRNHIGGNCYTENVLGINVHRCGAHIFHTSDEAVWEYVNRFAKFNNFNEHCFNDKYQGIPIGGYTQIFDKLLDGIEVFTDVDFFNDRKLLSRGCNKTIFTGPIDEYYDYCFGELEYRSLRFFTEVLRNVSDFQGKAIVNYLNSDTGLTHIIEHKHFEFGEQDRTVITKEYPMQWKTGYEPYYSVNDDKNNKLYSRYEKLAAKDKKVIFGGRLGTYKYLNMDEAIAKALELSKVELG